MREAEAKVNELFNDFESLTIPVSAFVTFEEEDGKIYALRTKTQ